MKKTITFFTRLEYGYEEATNARVTPDLQATMTLIAEMEKISK